MAKSLVKRRVYVGDHRPVQYVLVADGGMARLLRIRGNQGKQTLGEVAALERPSAHSPARDLVTDRTGRVFDSMGRTRHGAESDYDPHAVEVDRFAKRISRRVDTERRAERINELIVIAEPRFLGVLRQQWSGPTRQVVKREVAKDLVRASDAQILKLALA